MTFLIFSLKCGGVTEIVYVMMLEVMAIVVAASGVMTTFEDSYGMQYRHDSMSHDYIKRWGALEC